jgi:hypothetical protein
LPEGLTTLQQLFQSELETLPGKKNSTSAATTDTDTDTASATADAASATT